MGLWGVSIGTCQVLGGAGDPKRKEGGDRGERCMSQTLAQGGDDEEAGALRLTMIVSTSLGRSSSARPGRAEDGRDDEAAQGASMAARGAKSPTVTTSCR